jgi:MoxR-like ATPase
MDMSKVKRFTDYTDIVEAVKHSYNFKPERLIMKELKWKLLVRSVLRGKNILLLGPTGSGKTLAAKVVTEVADRMDKYFYINMGATQDPRASLIGNTHFDKGKGTFFDESAFVKAIKTPNAIIHIDELSRGNPEAWNILITPLDQLQRYLRLDEKEGGEIVKVADGVTFIATANVGSEYTATRVMDKALLDRFEVKIEVDVLTAKEEKELLETLYPKSDDDFLTAITNISDLTREMEKNGQLSTSISTRAAVEMAGLSVDGFSLEDVAEAVIYPDYSSDGGADSERTKIKQIVQKFVDDPNADAGPPF